MIKRLFISLLLLYSTVNLYAGDISVELMKDCSIPLEPGQHCIFAFKVKNSGNEPAIIVPNFTIPSGWTCICPDTLFSVEPGQFTVRLLTVLIPLRCPAGIYDLTYDVVVKDTRQKITLKRELKITEKSGVLVKLIDAPAYVFAGEPFYTVFLLRNLSNSSKKISLASHNADIEGDTSIFLPADGSIEIKLLTKTGKIPVTRTEIITLESKLRDYYNFEPSTSSLASAFVKIIPLKERENDRFNKLPVDIKLAVLGKQTGNGQVLTGWQGEIYGKGLLAPGSEQHLEFRLRGPDQFQISPLGMMEEYYIHYATQSIHAFAGDKTFSLSPLTLLSRYGRGAEFGFQKGDIKWGAFYSSARYTPVVKDEQAVYASYNWKKNNYITTSYLRKNYTREFLPANLFSIQGGVTLFKNSVINAEAAYGLQSKTDGQSYRLNYFSEFRRWTFSGQFIYADSDYPGYYTNTRISNISIRNIISNKISLSLNYNHDDQNAALDTLYGTAPSTDNLIAGMIYHYQKGNYLLVSANNSERKDKMTLNAFHYKENTFRIQVYHRLGRFSFQLDEEAGQTLNIKDKTEGIILSSQLSAGVNPANFIFLNMFAGQTSSLRYTDTRYNQWIYGGNISATLFKKFKLYARYQNNFSPEEYYLDRNLFDLQASYKIGRNQEINVIGRKTLIRKRKEEENLAFSVGYQLRIQAPVTKAGVVCQVTGTLHKEGNTKVSGIILHLNGHTAVTDNEGNFTFVNIKPSTYNLIVDKTSMNVGEILDYSMPLSVTAHAGTENHIDLKVVNSCAITGKLLYMNKPSALQKGQILPPINKGAVLLEITNGNEMFRKLSDADGAFTFDNLRPGSWKIKIFPAALHEEQLLEQKEFHLVLMPGEEPQLNIGITLKNKTIQFQQEDIKIHYR